MIITLPMYDWPEVHQSMQALAEAIVMASGMPAEFVRHGDHTFAWRGDDLLLSQTCGYPFTHEYKGLLQYVATPHYDADGCEGPQYQSIILAREAKPLPEFKGSIAAFNSPDSMSGMLALKLAFAPYAEKGVFFDRSIETGSHLTSMQAVRNRLADVCAIDAVCVGMARRHRPDDLEGLVEVGRSPMVPSLPFVTRVGSVGMLRHTLEVVFRDPSLKQVRDDLLLSGISVLQDVDYDLIPRLENEINAQGGLRLSA
jgi:ABC-type phosphate/phosphonate transport system substrate-binding protein